MLRLLLLSTILCWFQPTGETPTGFALTVAGVPVSTVSSDEGEMTLGGVPGRRWCSEVPHTGTFDWGVSALWSGGEVPGSNSPKIHYGDMACVADFNSNGAVDLNDVREVLSRLGTACD